VSQLHPINQKLRKLSPNHQEDRTYPEKAVEPELWTPITGYSRYQVSNFGRVKSFVHRQPVILKPVKSPHGRGVPQVCLYTDDGIQERIGVNRLVATAFIPNPENLPMVVFIDGDNTNSHVSNLKWSDHKCEKQPRTTLTNAEALEIRALANSGKSQKEVARQYGVSRDVVSDIQRGKSFRSL
jgi:hypothetical protein